MSTEQSCKQHLGKKCETILFRVATDLLDVSRWSCSCQHGPGSVKGDFGLCCLSRVRSHVCPPQTCPWLEGPFHGDARLQSSFQA